MKARHIIIITIIVIAIGIIISSIFSSSTYSDFSESIKYPDKEVHIIGTLNENKEVVNDTMNNLNGFSFFLIDKKGIENKVFHEGDIPRHFKKLEKIVIIGKMEGDIFVANELLLKCPSKYSKQFQGNKE